MSGECLFCKIVAGAIPCEVVYADDDVFAFRDINPAAPTHVLVIPRKHIAAVKDAQPEDQALMGKIVLTANKVAEQEGLTADGFRYVINSGGFGGQTVYHLHLHVLGGRQMIWPPG